MSQLQTLLALLGPERRPVGELWRALGVERRAFTAIIATHRDELAAAGVILHTATHSQAGRRSQFVEADGRRIAALSRPETARTSGVVRYIDSYLETFDANVYELAEIKAAIDKRLAQAIEVAQADEVKPVEAQAEHQTYRQEWVKCGKAGCKACTEGDKKGHGPYWYAYWREGRKLRKKYLGKQAPI